MAGDRETDKPSGSSAVEVVQDAMVQLSGFVVAVTFMAGAGVFIYQIYLWLKLGVWTPIHFFQFTDWLGFDHSTMLSDKWIGLNKIIAWIMWLPLALMLIVSGLFIFFIILMLFGTD